MGGLLFTHALECIVDAHGILERMFGITRGKKRESIIAVADVESGSAGVAILSLRPKTPAQILVAVRSALPYEDRTEEQAKAGVLTQLNDAAEKALAAYRALGRKTPIASASAVIRAPWTHSKTLYMTSVLKGEEKITDKTIGTIAQQAIQKDTEFQAANVFETTVIRVTLNGYPTSAPVGKHASEIGVSILQSDCDSQIRSQVAETLTKVFSCPPARLHSGTRALITILRESTELPKDCVIVDMGSDASSVFAVRHGSIAEHIVVPEGTRTILKRLGGEKLPEETLSLMRLLARDHCEDAACATIRDAMGKAEPELVRIFGEAMAKLVVEKRLSNAMIISVSEDFAPWLSDLFSRIDFTQFTVTTQPFSPVILSTQNLSGFVADVSGPVSDLGLCVGSALVNIEEQGA